MVVGHFCSRWSKYDSREAGKSFERRCIGVEVYAAVKMAEVYQKAPNVTILKLDADMNNEVEMGKLIMEWS